MFRVNKVRRNGHQGSTPRELRECFLSGECRVHQKAFTSAERFSPWDRSASGCPSFDSEARWIEPSRAITALSRKLAASTPPSTSASLIMNLATASRLVSSLGPIPRMSTAPSRAFPSHVRDSFGAENWPQMSEGEPQLAYRCSHALRQAYHGTSERRECGVSLTIVFKLRHSQQFGKRLFFGPQSADNFSDHCL